MIVLRNRIGDVRAICRMTCFAPTWQAGEWHERFQAALCRRERAEGRPAPIGWFMGAVSLILGAVAVSSKIQDGLLYAMLCLAMAAIFGAVFLRLRNCQRTRVAILAPRSSDATIPWLWFAWSIAAALAVLAYVGSQWEIPAILVCFSTLATAMIAWRLTRLPAILTGTDLAAEQVVDDRLRRYRACSVLALSFVQPFVLASQDPGRSDLQTVAYWMSWAGFVAFTLWQLRWQRRTVEVA
jgi:hypothetical protein